jgi:rhodanese-related sulfurtransferase
MTTTASVHPATFSFVREYPAADPAAAHRHFLARLSVETDVADLVVDLERGTGNLVVLDVRPTEDHARCHIPGAISLPHRQISRETTAHIAADAMVVVYCWGPACNSATKAAARLAALGFQVKELLGGLEYWRHESCPVEGTLGEDAPLYWSSRS